MRYYFRAIKDIFRYGVFRYILIPGIISALCFLGLYYILNEALAPYEHWLVEKWPFALGKSSIEWLSDKFSIVVFVLSFIFLFKYALFIVMSPFMSLLSEQVERTEYGIISDQIFKPGRFIKEILRGLRISIRNVIRELLLIILLMVLSLIPLVAGFSAVCIFIVQAYYAGFGNMDYTLERYYNVRDTADYVRRHRLIAIIHGSIFLLMLSIPVLGWFLATPIATIAATHQISENKNLLSNVKIRQKGI